MKCLIGRIMLGPLYREPSMGDYLLVCCLIAGAIFRDELLAVALFCRVPSTLVS